MQQRQIFLNNVIHSGFDTLRASRIRYAVKKEEQQDSVNAWVLILFDDCNWNEESDLPRISEAFRYIAKNDKDFPSIARFLEVLQPRKPLPIHQQLPSKPTVTAEEQKKNRKAAQHILTNFLNKTKGKKL